MNKIKPQFYGHEGFSIIEMIVTITVVSVLLTIALPKLFDNTQSQLAMAARMVRSDISAVQQMAVYEGKALRIDFDEDGYSVKRVDSETEVTFGGRFPVENLSDDLGVAIGTEGSVTFSSIGEPLAGSLGTISIHVVSNPDLEKGIVIEAETGHAMVE